MFPARAFPARFFAPRYWPKVGSALPTSGSDIVARTVRLRRTATGTVTVNTVCTQGVRVRSAVAVSVEVDL